MASSDTPEVEDLPFYQQLTSNYSDLFAKAQDICSIIIIPQHLSNSFVLTRDAFESHLFRPSPCYIRKHVSWNEKYEIELDNNHTIRIFYKKEGAGEKRVKVLSQEDVRDSVRQRNYSLLIVEQPIIDTIGVKNSLNGSAKKSVNKSSIPPVKFSKNDSLSHKFLFFLFLGT